jgi:hypothetical protein
MGIEQALKTHDCGNAATKSIGPPRIVDLLGQIDVAYKPEAVLIPSATNFNT